MPNISLATLAGIPGVNPATMTQANPNSCGAYAIVGAVGAFGVFPQVAPLAYANAGPQAVNHNANTALANNFHQLSAAVYTITGVLNNAAPIPPAPAVVPELIAAGNVYNSPAAMAQAAINLGRPAPNINIQAAGYAVLGAMYPGEHARCNLVVGAGNVNVAAGNHALPGAGVTHILCVQNGLALHWIAQGSNGSFYDPADGLTTHAWVTPVATGNAVGPYTFTGLWMVIN